MNIRAALERDSIMFNNIVTGGVNYDSSLNRYTYPHSTTNFIYRRIADACSMAGLEFSNADFNNFVAILRGYSNGRNLPWDGWLQESWLLPGEIIDVNPGMDSRMCLLKLKSGSYLVLDAVRNQDILTVVSTREEQPFELQGEKEFYPFGDVEIHWLALCPPDRVSRAVDYQNSRIFNRARVIADISPLVSRVMVALNQGEFEHNFRNFVAAFAESGVSSVVLLNITNAYLKRYPALKQ